MTESISKKILDLKELKSKINTLDSCEQIEILKIIINNDVKYTQNKNGFFINLNKLNDETIKEIRDFIKYISNNVITDNKIDLKRM